MQERQEQTMPPMATFFQLNSKCNMKNNLRAEGCSDHMLKNELEDLRSFIATREAGKKERDFRIEARRKRSLDRDLDPYVEAEIRKIAGVSSIEVLDDIYGNTN